MMIPAVLAYVLLLEAGLVASAGHRIKGATGDGEDARGGSGSRGGESRLPGWGAWPRPWPWLRPGFPGLPGFPRGPYRGSRPRKGPPGRVPVRKIITFKPGTSALEYSTILESVGGKVVKEMPFVDSIVVDFPPEAAEGEGLQQILSSDNVLAVEDDFDVDLLCFFQSSPTYARQVVPWGVKRINAPNAWQVGTGKGVKIGIVDTGIDAKHPDLKQNVKGTVDVAGSGGDGTDLHGHGTHVAGTIAAVNNEIGVVGVAPEAEIYGVRAFDKYGRAQISNIVEGVRWCVENGMHVVNMSFGSKDESTSLRMAIDKGLARGIIFVAAAGNSGRDNSVVFPARHPGVVAVSAISQDDRVAGFSSRGPEVDVTAPGDKILSTYKGGRYKTLSGTSMAAPHATGTVAVILSANPGIKPRGALAKLMEGTVRLPGLSRNDQGSGLVDVARSVGAGPEKKEAVSEGKAVPA